IVFFNIDHPIQSYSTLVRLTSGTHLPRWIAAVLAMSLMIPMLALRPLRSTCLRNILAPVIFHTRYVEGIRAMTTTGPMLKTVIMRKIEIVSKMPVHTNGQSALLSQTSRGFCDEIVM